MKRSLAMMLALLMALCIVPTVAFAETHVAWIGETGYETLEAAVTAAKSGDTIMLGEGKYTLYGVPSDNTTKGKDLTFVGKGVEKTTWIIGAEVPDPNNSGTEYNSDYSFNGASVTFKDMTLNSYYSKEDINKSGYENYLGFAHTVNTLVDSCVINGVTAYWGYTSAAFRNTTFNAPVGGYALWSYSSATMTFDNCIFNSSGKVINVYNEGSTSNVTVNFNNCTVKNTGPSKKAVLNINDRLVSGFTINISGNNSVDGITADNMTCSCLFGFGGKEKNPESVNGTLYYSNNEKTVVTINDIKVWEKGERACAHNGVVFGKGSYNGDQATQYTDGYKDNAFEIITSADGYVKRCKYCGYQEPFYGELSNEIGLKRIVKQGQEVNIETANPKDTYKINGSSGITVDYTATMDMTKLKWEKQGSLIAIIPDPWLMLKNKPGQITEDTVVFLSFKFDDKIDLKAFENKYNAVVNKADVLKLTSDMFEIADEGGVQFDIENRKMTIKCKWNLRAMADSPEPIITLNGYGLPVKNDWNGSEIYIKNSGCVSGSVAIKLNPMGGAVAIAEKVPNVAANQVPSTTPPLDTTIQIPIVGGCKTDEFTLYYGGGSSGDDHNHYYPTTTPVPVIVIPPKTGDMTIWQSILNFLGIK